MNIAEKVSDETNPATLEVLSIPVKEQTLLKSEPTTKKQVNVLKQLE